MQLFPHQQEAKLFLLSRRRAILADQPRVGKTLPTAAAALGASVHVWGWDAGAPAASPPRCVAIAKATGGPAWAASRRTAGTFGSSGFQFFGYAGECPGTGTTGCA